MSRIGSLVGNLTVGVAGSVPTATVPINMTTPAVTVESKGQLEQAAGTGPTALNFQGVSNAVLVNIKATDKVTGNPVDIGLTIDSVLIPTCNEFVYVSQNTSVGITTISITTPAGNTVVIEYLLVGV